MISALRRRLGHALDRRFAATVETIAARTRTALGDLEAGLDERQDRRKADSDQRLAESLDATARNIVAAQVAADLEQPDPVADGLEALVDAVARLNEEVAELRARLDAGAADH
jgi:hypothetical protein